MQGFTTERSERFVGSLLGCACGDVLGAAVEMQSRQQILAQYPQLIRDFQQGERGLGYGRYTDDTEMSLALARSLVRCGDVDPDDCAAAYAEAFTPGRGYGRSATQVLTALKNGADWRTTSTMLFADGSYGNGGAMRIAPVGLLYGAGDYVSLRKKVIAAIWMTHSHAEAIEAAVLQARAIGLFCRLDERPQAGEVIDGLLDFAQESVMAERLRMVQRLLAENASADEVATQFGCGVRSADSWPPALWAALRYLDEPEEAIVQAVNLGGDTDTVGAMCGALVGALHGSGWLPARWLDELENGEDGRDELVRVARQLARVSVS